MNISEVAKLVGLSSKQIRDYEKSGLLKPAQRSKLSHRPGDAGRRSRRKPDPPAQRADP